jgi:hypothetical protein
MSKFRFAVSNLQMRQEGIIDSDSFTAAVGALGNQVEVHAGDTLEIGVLGFPPARYECMGRIDGRGQPFWVPRAA